MKKKEIHKFRTLAGAKRKQTSMRKKYGYKPEIKTLAGKNKKTRYTIYEPKGMHDIRKYK